MSVPNFADIAKASNDLLNKDFYHLSAATLEVKSNTPNNVAFKVTGKTSHEKATAGAQNHPEKRSRRKEQPAFIVAAVGFTAPAYTAAITATDNLSIFAASYYHKVNSQVEAGAKATWNSKTGNNVGLEVASKYRIDPVSFAKVKVNDRGVAALAYNVLLRPGVTLGLGASFDTQKLDQATHKLGASFTFEG
ncbi:hypothetical protein BN1708_007752 [Verticillium longisporum]|uniref:Mitochondrial outer membrane protein porin n=1 Tax=Verticillium longisporum TaxID=100787 RepID=A0A0G4MWB1_VERLO|nr:hypothetical protein BN1708_007752 [Verticillium longisporum]